MKPCICILIVDDHALLREGVGSVLEMCAGFEVVGEAANIAGAVAARRKHRPDVTLMDLLLPDGHGSEAVSTLRREAPDARFLMLTTYDGDEDIHGAFEAGAAGYLFKNVSSDELEAAIRAVFCGQKYIPPAVARRLAERSEFEELTSRELEVLAFLVRGLANKQIAGSLGCSELTVKAHLRNILAKLNVESRTEAAALAQQRGLVRRL
jgi:DNA-binding NarL/FixJ family response regulator